MKQRNSGTLVYVDLLSIRNEKLGKVLPSVPDGPTIRMNLTPDDVLEINRRIRESTQRNENDRYASMEFAGGKYSR